MAKSLPVRDPVVTDNRATYMKKMTSDQNEAWTKMWNPISGISNAMGLALYALNNADVDGLGFLENGLKPRLAGEPFDLLHRSWVSMINLQCGYAYVEINWGAFGGGSFAADLEEAVRAEFLARWASDEADDANSDAGAEAEAQDVYGDAQ